MAGTRACKPGCDCKRHSARHRDDCACNRCAPKRRKPANVVEFKPRANANPYTCWCEHHEESHDIFGCRACDKMGRKCQRFRSKASTPPEPPKDYADEIKKAGFINHNGDLATCSTCWGVVKLGDVHKVSAVINAKAHNQTYHEKPRDTSRPNRAG